MDRKKNEQFKKLIAEYDNIDLNSTYCAQEVADYLASGHLSNLNRLKKLWILEWSFRYKGHWMVEAKMRQNGWLDLLNK